MRKTAGGPLPPKRTARQALRPDTGAMSDVNRRAEALSHKRTGPEIQPDRSDQAT